MWRVAAMRPVAATVANRALVGRAATDGGIAAANHATSPLRRQHAVALAARANQPPAVPLPPSVQSYPGALQPTAIAHKLHQSRWRLQVGCGTETGGDELLMTPQERGWSGAGSTAVRAIRLHRAALRKRHESYYAGGAHHWESGAYKRGGGLAHAQPLPAVGCDDFSQEEFGAAVKELTQAIRAAYQSRRDLRGSDGDARDQASGTPLGPLSPTSATATAAIDHATSVVSQESIQLRTFGWLENWSFAIHDIATELVDRSRHWEVSDSVRLQIARHLLVIAARESECAIRYFEEQGLEQGALGISPLAEAAGSGQRPEKSVRTWHLFRILMDAQARLGVLEEFEQTVVQFNQLVQAQCDRAAVVEEHGADPAAAVRRRRIAARMLIAEQRVQLHAVRGEWNECAQQHLAALRSMAERGLSLEQKSWLLRLWKRIAAVLRLERLFSSEPGLGIELEMAAKFAALSHTRLMQPSPAHSAAVLDAQHAVALLGSHGQAANARTLNQVRAVVDAEAELGVAASPSERVGDVHYRDLLSVPVLERVLIVY